MLRTWTRLDDETEGRVAEIIDAAVAVHRELGPGFLERVYHNAMCLELTVRSLPFECEKAVVITYKGRPVGTHRLDLIVCDRVVVELKAAKGPEPVHLARMISYLKASEIRVGLLMNFGFSTLAEGLKRVVL